MKEKNFVLTVENIDSPVIITIPHGGMTSRYGSWLKNFFKPRIKSEDSELNNISGEKVVMGGDSNIIHVAMDILKGYQANIIVGLLPRTFVDYNRFIPEVAYFDPKIKTFYDEYHNMIQEKIEILLTHHKNVFLLDLHGFSKQPIKGKNFDLILGTNNRETSPSNYDKLFYDYFSSDYEVFLSGADGLPIESDLYRGDTTNLYYYKKYNIDTILLEVSPKFRTGGLSKECGENLSNKLAGFLNFFQNNLK